MLEQVKKDIREATHHLNMLKARQTKTRLIMYPNTCFDEAQQIIKLENLLIELNKEAVAL